MTAATAKTYDRQTAKFLARVGENMPEMDSVTMQGWIDNPTALQKALRNVFCPPETAAAQREFKTWRTIKLGTHKSWRGLAETLGGNGFRIGDYAAQILKKITVAPAETEIELVVVSVAELGFEKGATRADIYKRGIELGLDLVPNEAGPQLRLQYPNQPYGEWLRTAMEPLSDSDGDLDVFDVEHDNGDRWLYAGGGDPTDFWFAEYRWVFARRKNQTSDAGSVSTL